MKITQENIKNIARSIANTMIEGDAKEWPPECPFVLYQPHRPDNSALENAPQSTMSE